MKFLKLDSIEKFVKKLESELSKMYKYNGSHEDKYWSLKREIKIKSMLKRSGEEYQRILHGQ